jgi:hypothetical protein
MMKTVLEIKGQLDFLGKTKQKAKSIKIKKHYAKNKQCEYENCDKKYSSQIALNAHLKKAHRKIEEDSS